MKKITLFIAAALCISSGLLAQNNPLNLKKGQKYLVENKIVTNSSTEMQGQSMEVNVDVSSNYNIEVKELANNNYNLSNTITAIKMYMTQMGQEMSFDSDKKEDLEGPIGSGLKAYINQPQSVLIDKSGKVITPKKEANDDENSLLLKQFGDFEATGYGADMAFESLPQNLKVGSAWTNKSDKDGISKTTNYTIKAINGKIATVSLSGTIASEVKIENQGMEITTKTSGKFTGEEKVDISTGVIQSNTTTVDASGTLEVMGQELPTSSKITTTTTVKEI